MESQAIADNPKALYGWMSDEYCQKANIMSSFKGNNDEPIPDGKLRAIINEPENALDKLLADAKWVVDRFTEDIRFSVFSNEFKCC